MMKLWFPPITLPRCTNHNRTIPSYTLHLRHLHRLFIRSPHLPRRKLRVNYPQPTRQRSLIFLHLHLPTYWTRTILRLLPIQRNLKHWSSFTTARNNNRIRRLRPTMRTNIILRRYRNHEPPIRCALHRKCPCPMDLRRILR